MLIEMETMHPQTVSLQMQSAGCVFFLVCECPSAKEAQLMTGFVSVIY